MKRLFYKQQNPKITRALKIIGYTALGIAAAAFLTALVLLPILSSIGLIKFY